MDIGLVLSGGGAKGAAHIGVIKALLEEDINIKYISGCSSGSIVASLYFAGYTPAEILDFFNMYGRYIKDYDKGVVFKFIKGLLFCNVKVQGLLKGNNLENILRKKLNKKGIYSIKDYKKKIAIPVVDLTENKVVYFANQKFKNDEAEYIENFDIAKAVRASCSFPGVFVPVNYAGRVFVDGGVLENVPIEILRKMGCRKIVAVVFAEEEKTPALNNFIDIIVESFQIQSKEMQHIHSKDADVLITLKLPNISLLDVEKATFAANKGYYLVKKNIEKIKNALK